MRLAVVDAPTSGPISLARALLRSLVIVLEVAAASTLVLALPAFAELISSQGRAGQSLTDRMLGTRVVTSARRSAPAPVVSFEA
jgi:hypothetical protein